MDTINPYYLTIVGLRFECVNKRCKVNKFKSFLEQCFQIPGEWSFVAVTADFLGDETAGLLAS